jgi:hypothetical protein
MANAIAQQQDLSPGPMGFQITYNVIYSGTDVNTETNSDMSTVVVDFQYADTPQTMSTKIGAAVRSEGTRLGYSVGTNAVVTPGFTKA